MLNVRTTIASFLCSIGIFALSPHIQAMSFGSPETLLSIQLNKVDVEKMEPITVVEVIDLDSPIDFKDAKIGDNNGEYVANYEDLLCLARNIYHEARSESYAGQLAVGLVTMNRVKSPNFPNNVCKVVYQGSIDGGPPKPFPGGMSCQFSWTCDNISDDVINNRQWEQSLEVSGAILSGSVPDFTTGALFYHADYVKPKWRTKFYRIAKIDTHIFYRPKNVETTKDFEAYGFI
jgi:spore germination cell wall hydrolase CwlJ-like protein